MLELQNISYLVDDDNKEILSCDYRTECKWKVHPG